MQFAWTLAVALLIALMAAPAFGKAPGSRYCYKGVCHRVKTLAETERMVGKTITLTASHYGHCRQDPFNPCGLTSSGERFRANVPDNAASPDLPDGTILLLYYRPTGNAVVVRVNNAGPYWGNRRLDVSRGTARSLGFARRGVAKLQARVLRAPKKYEARYRRYRRYRAVPGFIGRFTSIEAAFRKLRSIASVDPANLSQAKSKRRARALEVIPIRVAKAEGHVWPNATRVGSKSLQAGPLAISMAAPRASSSQVPTQRLVAPGPFLDEGPVSRPVIPPAESIQNSGTQNEVELKPTFDIANHVGVGGGTMQDAPIDNIAGDTAGRFAEFSVDGFVASRTIRSERSMTPTVVAWSEGENLLERLETLTARVRNKARQQLAKQLAPPATLRQKSQRRQTTLALGAAFSRFTKTLGGMMKFAAASARARVEETAEMSREKVAPRKAIRTSGLLNTNERHN